MDQSTSAVTTPARQPSRLLLPILAMGLALQAGAIGLHMPSDMLALGTAAAAAVLTAAALLLAWRRPAAAPATGACASAADTRLRAALDACQTNVMVADENYAIAYMNTSMQSMLKAAETDLRNAIPAFDAGRLMGANIDMFHKNPAHQRKILDGLDRTFETDITVGGRNFHLIVTPVRDEAGTRTGTVVEWKDETAQRALAEQQLRMQSALDSCSTNVMVADEDCTIVYMNRTLVEMLSAAEADIRKELPKFKVDGLIGTSMDVFHKNPAHQRKLISTLTQRYEADIRVGVRRFHLIATPFFDQKGVRGGTVVEWKDITAEKAIEDELNTVIAAAIAGDFERTVPTEGKHGFMLNLATAMNSLCSNVSTIMQELVAMLRALSEGDLSRRITADTSGVFAQLKTDANLMAERLTDTINGISQAAREVANAAREIATSTTDLSQRTEEQAAGLEQTSASMEEMAATVRKNAEVARHADNGATNLHGVAEQGSAITTDAVTAMSSIDEASRKIVEIISVIDEIARQTNLLALNAAVEAARAGEAGRGFAVVASEVRTLAQRSAQAAKDIKDLIGNSEQQVKHGVDLVNRTGAALAEITQAIKEVAASVADIANASAEQATGIDQVNKALVQMDEVTQQNSALVEQNAATAKTLEQQSAEMARLIAFFRVAPATQPRTVEPGTQDRATRAA